MKHSISKLLGISVASYYRWKEDRPIISFLEKYFTAEELEEFIDTGEISKLEKNEYDVIKYQILEKRIKKLENQINPKPNITNKELANFANETEKTIENWHNTKPLVIGAMIKQIQGE